MNINACDSISEAFQRQYSFQQHQKRLSELSDMSKEPTKIVNLEYNNLKLNLDKNRLKRRHHTEKDRLSEIERGNKALIERISHDFRKKRNELLQTDFNSISKLSITSSKMWHEQKKKEKIAEENQKTLEKIIFPCRNSPIHPSVEQQIKDHDKAMEYKERIQKSKQHWKVNFSRIWKREDDPKKLNLPIISPRRSADNLPEIVKNCNCVKEEDYEEEEFEKDQTVSREIKFEGGAKIPKIPSKIKPDSTQDYSEDFEQ